MLCIYINIIIIIIYTKRSICDTIPDFRSENIYVPISSYIGETFPKRYLSPEDYVPTTSDLEYYLKSLQRTINYFDMEIRNNNDTEINRAVGMFFMKALLKKIIHEYRRNLEKKHYDNLKDLIRKGDDFVSRYIYIQKRLRAKNDMECRAATMIRDDTAQVYSIGNFNKGRLSKGLLSNVPIHAYAEKMDNLTLSKETYTKLTEAMDLFFVNIAESDECISRVVYNPDPIDLSELKPCRPDPYCQKAILSSPSIAYSLSHRLLNIMMLRHSRRCYVQTEKEDDELMDTLCAFMYREAVYIARRGYFARDLFLEHVALCALLGYEEFFRHQWFRKAVSWMDEQGCIHESHNFLINRTRINIQSETNLKKHYVIRKRLKLHLIEECHSHPMVLLIIVLSHAIRHTLHFMT